MNNCFSCNITQHHPRVDFADWFDKINRQQSGIGFFDDYRFIVNNAAELHSFLGEGDTADDLIQAIYEIDRRTDYRLLLDRASSVYIIIATGNNVRISLGSYGCIAMQWYIEAKFIDKQVRWTAISDDTLSGKQAIKLIFLLQIRV